MTPLGQGGGSGLFENVAAVEMSFVVEVVIDRGMDGGEFLQGLDVSEPRHRPFPPSERLVRVLGPVVEPTTAGPGDRIGGGREPDVARWRALVARADPRDEPRRHAARGGERQCPGARGAVPAHGALVGAPVRRRGIGAGVPVAAWRRRTGMAVPDREQPIHYFTMGEETWRGADQWPLSEAETTSLYLAADGALSPEKPNRSDASDTHRPDFRAGTGHRTRYERLSTIAVEAYYDDWHGRDERMLTYTSEPLSKDRTLSGHPVVTLHFASSEKDGSFFVYLEDVDPDGRTRYVTEGMLRAMHRKVRETPAGLQWVGPYHSLEEADAALLTPGEPAELAFSLYPTSWRFREGHKIRIAIAACDGDHFSHIPAGRIPELTFHRNAARASRIELPFI